jgi:two-component system KDP operon response regulator KdpE
MNNPAAHPVPTRFQPKVLLLCDRPLDAAAWAQALAFHHIDAIQAASADEGLRRWAELIPDLIVIDLPGEAGLEVCRCLRPEAAIPLLVLLDNVDESTMLQAYRAGADEAMSRTLSIELFLAKVSAWLRRAWTVPVESLNLLETGGLRLDPARREVATPQGGTVRLTNLEFRLLHLLMSNPGWALSPEDILGRVWGHTDYDSTAALKNTVLRLRKKIEPDPARPAYLLTEPGLGYRFRGI